MGKSTKEKRQTKEMRILGITQSFSGVGWHRIMMPLTLMEKDYCLITDVLNEEVLEKGFDIVVINRMLQIDVKQIEEWKNKYNFKLVIDNDDYWKLDPNHVLYERYIKGNVTNKIIDYLRLGDIATVTHERLAEEVYQYNPNVHILPNGIPYGEEQYLDKKIDSDIVRLFWSGSDTHQHDLKILKEPVKRFNNLPVKMVMAGYVDNQVWDTMAFYFSAGRKLDTKIYRYNEVTRYMEAYGDSDISLIPLVDSKFNAMKSNLKILETAAKGNPAIVSNVHPYKDMPVFYVNKQTDWYKWVKLLANDKALREESGKELFNYCNTHFNLHVINKQRQSIYKQIV
jgi:hypothetical protein